MGTLWNLILFTFLLIGVYTQDDKEAVEALLQNKTVTTQKPAPTTETPTPNITASDKICRNCVCKDGKVDCSDQAIDVYFNLSEWMGLAEFKPVLIDMSSNPIQNVTKMSELPVETFNLSRCNIEFIEIAAFRDLQQMKVLDLSWNKLSADKLVPNVFEGRYLPEMYEPLSSMKNLSLAHNNLHTLHQDLFEHLPKLAYLDLSGNPLMMIDHSILIAISSLPMLRVLKMRSCQLKEIPDKFLHTPAYLEHLDLSDNQLVAIPQEIEETKNLAFLSLNQNPIERLEKNSDDYPGFPTLKKLKELHMCNMDKLEYIGEGTLAGLQNLNALHMSYNPKLHFIHPKAMARVDDVGETLDWPPLRELYLHSTNLTEINSLIVSRWDLISSVDVSNNPYMCDCSTQWMVNVLVEVVERLKPNSSANMVCQEPIEMRGYTMKHLHDIHRTMRCVDKYGNRPERDGAILMGTLIGVLLSVPIFVAVLLLWKRGYFSRCGVRGPADYSRAFYKRAQSDEFAY